MSVKHENLDGGGVKRGTCSLEAGQAWAVVSLERLYTIFQRPMAIWVSINSYCKQ